MVTIKFLYKYRHWIASVLTVTVSLMLMVTSVSADRVSVMDTVYDHHCKEPVSDCTPFVTVDGSLPSMGSSGFVHNSYEDGGRYQYYYFTTDGVYETLYLYGNYHAKSSYEQIYSFSGEVFLPNFIDTFKIDLIYDNGSKEVTSNLVTREPFSDSFLRTHAVDTSSESALWSENSWYGSVSTEGRKAVEYYVLTIDEEVKIPQGSNNIRFALTFYNSSYKQVMFVLNECYIHHKYNGGVADDLPKEFKWIKGYDRALYEKFGQHSSILEFVEFMAKSKINEAFDIFNGLTNIITYIVTFFLDIGLLLLNPVIQSAVSNSLPVIEGILENIFSNTGIFVQMILPVIGDLYNRLAPEFANLGDIITNNFIEHFGDLTDALNDFIDSTEDANSDLVKSLIDNLRTLLKEFFVVSEDSEYVIEFEEQKDKLANKLPFISQIQTFFAALFNEENYSEPAEPVGSYNVEVAKFTAVEIYNMYPHVFYVDNSYLGLANVSLKYHRYTLPYEFEPGKEYCIKASTVQTSAMNAFSIINLDGKYKDCNNQEGYTGHVKELLILARDDVNVINIVVYEVTEPDVGWNFNVLGTSVNIFDFSWYLPYKAFGDSVILSFVYLSFGWRLYKRLFTLI